MDTATEAQPPRIGDCPVGQRWVRPDSRSQALTRPPGADRGGAVLRPMNLQPTPRAPLTCHCTRPDRRRVTGPLRADRGVRAALRTALCVTDVGVAVTVAGHAARERASVGRLVAVTRLARLAELAHVAVTDGRGTGQSVTDVSHGCKERNSEFEMRDCVKVSLHHKSNAFTKSASLKSKPSIYRFLITYFTYL